MNRRTLCAFALIALVAAGGTACSDDKSSSAAAPGTSSSAAPAQPAAPGDYCQAMVQLSRSTRELGSKSDITPADYAKTADQFDQVKAVAPAEVTGDLDKISAGYRAISKGQATIDTVGPDIAQASLHMTQVNMEKCGPPTAPR
ncbi:hypothetical protein ACIA8C_01995 [Nocardia sp. NPDC051321]|uniref:hypothetical protein n=1 Tax=Nocardia sp. NPDC051321 TaxID=3364323 RepID=UPI0037BC3FB4